MSDLPTKPGHYYWRESEGGEWEIAQINRCMDVYFVGCDMHYGLKETGGEWLPIPPPPFLTLYDFGYLEETI